MQIVHVHVYVYKSRCAGNNSHQQSCAIFKGDTAELLKYFKTWEYSLFNIPSPSIAGIRSYSFDVSQKLMKWAADANIAAASHLVKEDDSEVKEDDSEEVLRYINSALQFDPTSIHAWCNKGVYHLLQDEPELKEAQEAKEKMERLLRTDEALEEAKVEYGYWLFEAVRTMEMRQKGLDLLVGLFTSGNTKKLVLHYAFMKVLVRKAKNKVDYDKDKSWLRDVLKNMLKQMVTLAHSDDPVYEMYVWTYLADVQTSKPCEDMLLMNMRSELQELAEATKTLRNQPLNIEFCIQKMLELESNPNVKTDSNFHARLGKFYMRLATGEHSNEERRIELLEKSVGYGEKYQQDAIVSKTELGPEFCAQALFNLWAVKFNAANPARTRAKYKASNGNREGECLFSHPNQYP